MLDRWRTFRHEHTKYDKLLMELGERAAAREAIREKLEEILASWEGGQANPQSEDATSSLRSAGL